MGGRGPVFVGHFVRAINEGWGTGGPAARRVECCRWMGVRERGGHGVSDWRTLELIEWPGKMPAASPLNHVLAIPFILIRPSVVLTNQNIPSLPSHSLQ